jgi:small multidrug resistance pump
MGWVFLALAIAFEIAGTISLTLTAGFTRLTPIIAVVVFYLVSFGALGLALKTVPVSVAYAIWSAIGIAIVSAVGMTWFGESVSALKVAALAIIVAGVVLLFVADQLAAA